jgi:Zn-dependent peptidase ImmA (M78 family)
VSYVVKRLGGSEGPEEQARDAAARFRAVHHLGSQALGDLAALIEQTTNIDVAVLDASPDEHGMAMRDPARRAVFIAVARTPHPMRQRSSLAHELAHVLFEDWTNGGAQQRRSPAEIRADAFARHLLIPADGLREQLGSPDSIGPALLSLVVQRFLVSPAIAAIALRDAGYIDEATQQSWREITTPRLAARYGWADQYQALSAQSQHRRAPQRLLARAIDGYLAHVVSAQTIATLRGMSAASVEAELRAAGIEPAEQPIAWAEPADLPPVEVDFSALDEIEERVEQDPPSEKPRSSGSTA